MLALHHIEQQSAIAQERVAVAASLTVNRTCGNPASVVDADPRIISHLMIDIGFNSPAAVAVWSNNR